MPLSREQLQNVQADIMQLVDDVAVLIADPEEICGWETCPTCGHVTEEKSS
jgi:hypothetical protein